MSTTAPTPAPTPAPTNPATRVRDALRGVRAAYRGDSIPLELRRTLGTLEVAVEAMLAADADLRDRIAVARAGAQATVDASDTVAARLRVVRAHIELALDASVAGRARAHEHAAVSMLHDLGVPRPDAATLATATVAVTP